MKCKFVLLVVFELCLTAFVSSDEILEKEPTLKDAFEYLREISEGNFEVEAGPGRSGQPLHLYVEWLFIPFGEDEDFTKFSEDVYEQINLYEQKGFITLKRGYEFVNKPFTQIDRIEKKLDFVASKLSED